MDKAQKNKNAKVIRQSNVLESLKDIGSGSVKSFKEDFFEGTGQDIWNQMFAPKEQRYSGDLIPGEPLEVKDVFSGKHEENIKLKKQVFLERRLSQEEKAQIEKKTNELKIQLHALIQEVAALAKATQGVGEQVEIASMQAPINPGVYHVVFFEKLLEFIKSFRKKVEDASVWLQATNKRAEKRNYWAMYKKKGSSFLLAPDHYLQRSAG